MMLGWLVLSREDGDTLSAPLVEDDRGGVIASLESLGAVSADDVGATFDGLLIEPQRRGQCVDLSAQSLDGVAMGDEDPGSIGVD